MTVFPVIAVCGMPRVGSMWSFNVTRALTRAAGLQLRPEQVPRTNPEMLAVAAAYVRSQPANTRCVIKVHAELKPSPQAKVIVNRRDVRDRLLSYLRFMKSDFDEQTVIDAVAAHLAMDRHYARWPDEYVLHVPFESIENDSTEIIRRIAHFAGLPEPDARTLDEIDRQYSKRQVQSRIADIEERVFDSRGQVRDDANPDAVLDAGLGTLRAYDSATGFQSGHVSNRRPGDWRHVWTEREKRIVDDAIRHARADPGEKDP